MSKPVRAFLGVLLALALGLCAFIPGMWVGGQTVGKDQGLAGGAIVFLTGLSIATGAFVVGALLAYFLPARLLKVLTAIATVPAAVIAVVIGYHYFAYRSEADAFLDDQIAHLPPFTLKIVHSDAAVGQLYDRISFDTSRENFTTVNDEGATCSGTIAATSRDKVELLTALRNVEILLAQHPTVCRDGGAMLHEAEFEIHEAKPPYTTGRVAITEACLAAHDPLRALITTAREVYESNRATESCG